MEGEAAVAPEQVQQEEQPQEEQESGQDQGEEDEEEEGDEEEGEQEGSQEVPAVQQQLEELLVAMQVSSLYQSLLIYPSCYIFKLLYIQTLK